MPIQRDLSQGDLIWPEGPFKIRFVSNGQRYIDTQNLFTVSVRHRDTLPIREEGKDSPNMRRCVCFPAQINAIFDLCLSPRGGEYSISITNQALPTEYVCREQPERQKRR
jgi:hypothetical protein